MISPGKSIMAIWHGITPAYLDEFRTWHTKEHIPDRVSTPGFESGRRYENPLNPLQPFFTMYIGGSVEAFRSEAYLARLREPTPGTAEAMKHFTNFARCACEVIESAGNGIGNCITTIRLNFQADAEATFFTHASEIAACFSAMDTLSGIHIARARPEVMNSPTKDVSEEGFDALILIEGVSQHKMALLAPEAASYLGQLPLHIRQTAIYDFAYAVEK